MSSDFNKSGMDNYLKELAKEYRRMVGKNMPAEIVLVGGAAILANYGFRESTQDIDAIITAASAMKDAITVVGDRYDLPSGWLNSDFIKTDSYSPKLIEFSCYYRTFANVVTVRTIEAEYLIAMKLRAGRQYKYDLSDVIGILAECKRSGNPVSPEQIRIAYEWRIDGKSAVGAADVNAFSTYGTSRINAYKILENTLNLRDVRIYDKIEDADGTERRVLNVKETTLAQQKQQVIKDAFRDWLWKDPKRRETLVAKYNELFNSTRPREYDGSHLTFPGMNPEIELREHQRNAIARILYGGNTLLAHEVGAGKTFTMAAAAMEAKRLGLCRKPKQRFISQIMTSKSPVRSCEDADETTLSYAEVKALCAGDPRIRKKMDLDVQVAKLRLLKSSHQSQKYQLEDRLLQYFPREIAATKAAISGCEADVATRDAHPAPVDSFAGIELQGLHYDERIAAGEALMQILPTIMDTEPVHVGSFRGFDVEVSLEQFGKHVLTLKGRLEHHVELGADARGNISRIENALTALDKKLGALNTRLADLQRQVENAREELEKPFPQEDELREKSARLVELNAELDMENTAEPQEAEKPSVLAKLKEPIPLYEPKQHQAKEACR